MGGVDPPPLTSPSNPPPLSPVHEHSLQPGRAVSLLSPRNQHVPGSGDRQLPDPPEAAGEGAGEGERLPRQQQPEQQQGRQRQAQQTQCLLARQTVWIQEETEEKATTRSEGGKREGGRTVLISAIISITILPSSPRHLILHHCHRLSSISSWFSSIHQILK